MRSVHYCQLVFAALIAAASAVAQNDPALAHYALDIVAALTPVLGILGVVSHGANVSVTPPPPAVVAAAPKDQVNPS